MNIVLLLDENEGELLLEALVVLKVNNAQFPTLAYDIEVLSNRILDAMERN